MMEVDWLTFDEVKISEEVSFDKGTEKIIEPHSYIIQHVDWSVVGWKQPIFYSSDRNVRNTILKRLLQN
jgi:hypothetical protein